MLLEKSGCRRSYPFGTFQTMWSLFPILQQEQNLNYYTYFTRVAYMAFDWYHLPDLIKERKCLVPFCTFLIFIRILTKYHYCPVECTFQFSIYSYIKWDLPWISKTFKNICSTTTMKYNDRFLVLEDILPYAFFLTAVR